MKLKLKSSVLSVVFILKEAHSRASTLVSHHFFFTWREFHVHIDFFFVDNNESVDKNE